MIPLREYDYTELSADVRSIKEKYPFIEVSTAGVSTEGRNLYVLRLGKGGHQVFYNGAHHALEWITSLLLMQFVDDYARSYINGVRLRGYSVRNLFAHSSIYIMPMVNPDGIERVLHYGKPFSCKSKRLRKLYKSFESCEKKEIPENVRRFRAFFQKDWSLYRQWQSNANGVDLNHNYNAGFSRGKEFEKKHGILGPGPTRYGGKFPESEPESRAVADFTRTHNFARVLALHSQGEEIFWNFDNLANSAAKNFAHRLGKVSGYTVASPEQMASVRGYKDWFIKEWRRPGYTIEVGKGKNPLPLSQFQKIYNNILEMLMLSAT